MNPEQLRKSLEFYRDLGVDTIYRRTPSGPAAMEAQPRSQNESAATPVPARQEAEPPKAEPEGPVSVPKAPSADVIQPVTTAPSTIKPPLPSILLPSLAPEDDTLSKIREDIGECIRCRLSQARKKIVFGSGNEQAKLVFVGEGPGADEDEQGIPFVGRAGQLLTQMIDNTASREGIPIRRDDVYICNVVKCRPPENRTPQPDEMATCGQFLYRQLMTIKPKAICALGATAMKALLNTKQGITKVRGEWLEWNGIPVMITYHPSYLLRQYNKQAKREAWEDLKKVLHFVYD